MREPSLDSRYSLSCSVHRSFLLTPFRNSFFWGKLKSVSLVCEDICLDAEGNDRTVMTALVLLPSSGQNQLQIIGMFEDAVGCILRNIVVAGNVRRV